MRLAMVALLTGPWLGFAFLLRNAGVPAVPGEPQHSPFATLLEIPPVPRDSECSATRRSSGLEPSPGTLLGDHDPGGPADPPCDRSWARWVRVLDWDGEPVPDAGIYTFGEHPLPSSGGCFVKTESTPLPDPNRWRTDETGTCQVSLVLPGAWMEEHPQFVRVHLYASKPGLGGSRFASVEIDDEEGPITLVLLARCPVTGTVVDSGGLPVCGASVRFQSLDWPELPDHQDPRVPPEAISDPDGCFRTEIDSDCEFSIQARRGEEVTDAWTLSGSDGEPLTPTLRFPGPYAIDGSVRDATGMPLPEADVVARDVRFATDGEAQPEDSCFFETSEGRRELSHPSSAAGPIRARRRDRGPFPWAAGLRRRRRGVPKNVRVGSASSKGLPSPGGSSGRRGIPSGRGGSRRRQRSRRNGCSPRRAGRSGWRSGWS